MASDIDDGFEDYDINALEPAGPPADDGDSGDPPLVRGSEDALAQSFVDQYHMAFKWTSGMDWMRDSGFRWESDDNLRRYSLARIIARQAAATATPPSTARKIASSSTVNGLVNLARADPRIALPIQAWDSDPMALNTPAGIVDLRSGKLRARCGDFVTRVTRVTPDWKTPTPYWTKFLEQVFCQDEEMIEFMRRLLGYFITADRREQKIFFAHGIGSNGKSTLFNVFQWIVGDYALDLPAEVLMTQKNPGHPTELAQLMGVRIAISGEIERGSHWAEARINRLTGEETMSARVMRGDPFTFTQTQKHLVIGNHKPKLKGGDPALVRRFVLIPFDAVFSAQQRDKNMINKLRSEAAGILAWVIQGAVEWSDGGLQVPSKIEASSSEYMESNDDVALWIDECCILGATETARAADLYWSFSQWIRARGQFACSLSVWADMMAVALEKNGIRAEKRRSNGIRYGGIGLNADQRSALVAHQAAGAKY